MGGPRERRREQGCVSVRLRGDVGAGRSCCPDVWLMRDGTQIPHRPPSITCRAAPANADRDPPDATRRPEDRPNDPWPPPGQIRILWPMRILPGLIACLAGCAAADPGLRVADPPHAATPADIDRADLTFIAGRGLTLYGQYWRPRTREPRGAVVIHHGLADHSD